jgi:hypothetical protein
MAALKVSISLDEQTIGWPTFSSEGAPDEDAIASDEFFVAQYARMRTTLRPATLAPIAREFRRMVSIKLVFLSEKSPCQAT